MEIGCFALIQPFSPMRRQFELIRQLGFDGPTTLEIAGEEAVKISAERLRQWAV